MLPPPKQPQWPRLRTNVLRTKSGGATTVDSSLHSLNSSCRYVSARVRCIIKRRSEALTHDGQKHFAHRLPAQVQARKVGLRLVGRASGQCTPRAPKQPLKAVCTCALWPLLVPVSDPFQVRLWSWQPQQHAATVKKPLARSPLYCEHRFDRVRVFVRAGWPATSNWGLRVVSG